MLLLESSAASSGVEDAVSEIVSAFHIPRIAVSVIVAVCIFIAAKVVTSVVRKFFSRIPERKPKFTPIMASLVIRIINVIVWIIAVVAILGAFGIDLTPVLAGLGITGVVLGFALQESIGSLFSGIMIAINNPFRVGDWVEIGQDGVAGTVVDMDLMCVTLSTADNKKYTVSNNYVWNNTILNASYTDKRRLDMTVSVRYTDDIEKTKEVLEALIKKYPEILPDPAPMVEVGSYADSAIIFYVRPWVRPSDYWTVYWRFNGELLDTLRANGIDMPYNQLVVQLDKG